VEVLIALKTAPESHPLLGSLVAGFVLLVLGLAALTLRRRAPVPLASAASTRRALLYTLVYGLCVACFGRVVSPALLGREHSPWLLALGDVMFVTLALFFWVMALAEEHPLRDYGFHAGPAGRMLLALLMGAGAAAFYAAQSYGVIASGQVVVTADSLVFAVLFAALGSALPGEFLFRGFLQGSLTGRAGRWARVVAPALVFTVVRSVRFLPGLDLPPAGWLLYAFGTALPLGVWWGLMRDVSGGSLWPGLLSHFVLEFGVTLANASPGASIAYR
jgi:membrane protease YdiL (CAAX protease family)